jgi:hypothetical protein
VFVLNVLAHHINNKPIILTLDGHDSHKTSSMQHIAHENNIILFCFPSKTTHMLQPLNVTVFSPVQHT